MRNFDPSSGNVGKGKKGNLIRRNERNGPRRKCCLSLELCAELCFNVLPVFAWIYAFSSMYVWREGTETEKKSTNGIPPQPHTATYAPNYFFLPSEWILTQKKKIFFEWRMETGAQSMVQDPKNILKYTCLFLDNDKMFLNMSVLSNFFISSSSRCESESEKVCQDCFWFV